MTTEEIQRALVRAGFDPGPIDGQLGKQTKAAVRAYQQARGLKADGIPGPLTQLVLGGPGVTPAKPSNPVVLLADLKALCPTGSAAFMAAFVTAWPALSAAYEINTPLRVQHFWAQIAHESDGMKTMQEYASGAAYEGRTDLGNTQKGDGKRFKGRGPFQLTGRANYAEMSKILGIDLIANPERAAEPEIGLRIACEYWKSRKLNALADNDDVLAISKKINGVNKKTGLPNGVAERKAYLAKAKRRWPN